MEDTTNCPIDGTINEPSAALGSRIHYHCRSCGMWYSATNECAEEDADIGSAEID